MREIVGSASWTRFQRPLAIWADGSLIIGHWRPGGCWITQVDQSGEIQGTFQLASTEFVDDDHNTTTIGIRGDGRIIAAYTLRGEPSPDEVRVRISENPLDVSSWGAEQELPASGSFDLVSYPQLFHLSSEARWYLFCRFSADPSSAWGYITSDDDGDTWSSSPTILTSDGDRPYLQIDSDGVGRVDISMTQGHPATSPSNSVYHLYYRAGNWYTSGDVSLGTPPFSFASLVEVWDGGVEAAWNWDMLTDGANPRMLFDTNPDDGTDNKIYRHARWDGTQWLIGAVSQGGGSLGSDDHGSGGVRFDRDNPDVVYLSREVAPDTWEIERMSTPDAGLTWSGRESVTSGTASSVANYRPIYALGSGPFHLLWVHGEYGTADRAIYADLATQPPGPPSGDALPQVAQARIRARLTWLSCNLSDGAVITELPDLKGDEVSRVIGEYTSANLSLPISAVGGRGLILAQRAQLAIQSTEPARTMIVPVVNDVPTAGFIPLTRDLGTDATIALGCVSLEGYLRHRYVRDHNWEGVDPAEIARGVLADAEDIGGTGQGINLTVDAPDVGLNAARHFEAIDDVDVYAALSELMDAGLIEWTVDVDWATGMAYRVVDKIARVRHRLGRSGDPQAVFQSATFSSQGASDARYTLKGEHSGDRYGNSVVARGTGEGEDKPRSAAATDQVALDAGAPIWEQRVDPEIYRSPLFTESEFNAYMQEQLGIHAAEELARIRGGGRTLEITARWDAPGARYGVDWALGDDVRHELRGHAHPGGFSGVRRAIGFALSIQRGTIRPILQEEL